MTRDFTTAIERDYSVLLTKGYPWVVFVADHGMALAIEVGDRALQHFTPSVWGRSAE